MNTLEAHTPFPTSTQTTFEVNLCGELVNRFISSGELSLGTWDNHQIKDMCIYIYIYIYIWGIFGPPKNWQSPRLWVILEGGAPFICMHACMHVCLYVCMYACM